MSCRSEQRTAISLPISVHGFDSRRSPFTFTAETQGSGFSRARLRGLNGFVVPGMKIEIECRRQKAWFRVQWVSKGDTSTAGQRSASDVLSLRSASGAFSPRNGNRTHTIHTSSAEETTEVPDARETNGGALSLPFEERRNFPRRACRFEVQVTAEDDSAKLPARVTDISLSGCFVEMLAPLSVGTRVELSLNPGNTSLHASGMVRSSQMGLGMGVSFTGMSPEDFEKLRQFVPPASATSETTRVQMHPAAQHPQRRPSLPRYARPPAGSGSRPNDLPTTAEALEAVVRVLFRKGFLTREELSEELEKLKVVRT